jgi:CheY-like chemotaxis protein
MSGKDALGGGDEKLLAGLTILVVEDEDDLRELLQVSLSHHGADVRTAATAEHALLLDLDGIHVLVADIGLPGIDGFDLLQRLRRRNPSLPAVALTGFARDEDRAQALRAGYQLHVSKPIDGAALVEAIASLAHSTK